MLNSEEREMMEEEVYASRCDMNGRNRRTRRKNNAKKAISKRNTSNCIVNDFEYLNGKPIHYDFYDNLHQYSKNKIFTSSKSKKYHDSLEMKRLYEKEKVEVKMYNSESQ